jgi:pimeloyl-ACP methyl ester carboxylesterase
MRSDWENVVRPVVDYALTRSEVDPTRLALAGWGFGGYLALRGAGGEPRLGACIADPGFTGLWDPMKEVLRVCQPMRWPTRTPADPALCAPYIARIESSPAMRWKVAQPPSRRAHR